MGLFSKKQKNVKLLFCTNNIDRFYDDDAFDELEDFIENHPVKVKEMDCLSYCDECECSPYVLADQKFVEAESPQHLLAKLKEYVKQ